MLYGLRPLLLGDELWLLPAKPLVDELIGVEPVTAGARSSL